MDVAASGAVRLACVGVLEHALGWLMARAREAARSGDLYAWTGREVQNVLAEMRATNSEGT